MLNVSMTTAFEDIQKTHQVGIGIGVWVFQRITHTCLRCKVYDAVKLFISKKFFHPYTVGNIQPGEAE
ncbi:Uncharacterised protein [Klebsiella aerogenes]|nr:Uncharacterised protein [Klebsiella aerogenes]